MTLRWREPKPPHNGEISHYGVKISLYSADTTHVVLVYPNETCQLWSDLICKTIDQPFGERQYIQVSLLFFLEVSPSCNSYFTKIMKIFLLIDKYINSSPQKFEINLLFLSNLDFSKILTKLKIFRK